MTGPLAIDVTGLRKSFGTSRALNGLDLSVAAGTVAGFLGPNGSGKSTTLRILLGLLRSDGGTARVLGGDPWRDAVELHKRLAYVPGDVTLWPNLTGGQAIDILSRLHGGVDRKRIDEYLQRFDLDPSRKARSYSKGNRQKVALVAALASGAELLLFDEPTSGLDPLMEGVFTQCVLEAKGRGQSVLLSSHIFAEVEKVCDTVTIIRQGRTVEAGALADLRHLQRATITVSLEGSPAALERLGGVYDVRIDGTRVTFSVDDGSMSAVLTTLASLGPRALVSEPPSLEELFLRHYGVTADAAETSDSPDVKVGA